MNEMSPIDSLKGIGEKTRAVFERAGISGYRRSSS